MGPKPNIYSSVYDMTHTVLYTVRRTQFSTLYDAHSSVHCTTHTVQYTVRRTQFNTLYDAHSSVHCTTHTVQYTVRRTQFNTLYDAHSSVHCTTHIVQQYDAHSSVLVHHEHLACGRSALLPFAQAADVSHGYRFARAASLANSSLAALCVSLTATSHRVLDI